MDKWHVLHLVLVISLWSGCVGVSAQCYGWVFVLLLLD